MPIKLPPSIPAFTAILAFFLLHERILYMEVFNVLLVIAAMTLIVKPPFIFGHSEEYEADPQYAIAAIVLCASCLIQASRLARICNDIQGYKIAICQNL